MTGSQFRVSDPCYEFIGGARLRAISMGRRMTNLPMFRAMHERRYQARLADYSAQLPTLSAADDAIVEHLNASHIASRPVLVESAVERAAHRAIAWLKANSAEQPVTYLPLTTLAEDTSLFTWGLTEQNLDIAERYIGLPVRYLGMEAKVEHARPAAQANSARNWHIDVEDRRMIKVIVYLNDVDEHAGPFEYIPAAVSDLARTKMRWRPGFTFLRDRELAAVVPHSDWSRVTGPATTAVYADTSRLIHRVREPRARARYSVTYVYTSQQPFHTLSRFMPPPNVLQSVLPTLTARQRRALAAT